MEALLSTSATRVSGPLLPIRSETANGEPNQCEWVGEKHMVNEERNGKSQGYLVELPKMVKDKKTTNQGLKGKDNAQINGRDGACLGGIEKIGEKVAISNGCGANITLGRKGFGPNGPSSQGVAEHHQTVISSVEAIKPQQVRAIIVDLVDELQMKLDNNIAVFSQLGLIE